LFLIGILLFVLGPVIYVIQFRAHVFGTPWYVPILATIGVLLMIVSALRRRGMTRSIVLGLLIFVCGLEWLTLLVLTKTPAYNGPAVTGHQVPAFTTTRADGAVFSDQDLAKGASTILLFFRGRW
jgi:hypothetical protein